MKMKKTATFFALMLVTLGYAQVDYEQWKNRKPEERKEIISRMSSTERVQMLKQFKEDMVLDEIEVPAGKQSEFRTLYSEYQNSQKKIKEGFKPREDYEKLTDSEARNELQKSFEVGEQLLENRKKYSEKFQKLVKPQQVLEMFQNEGNMRNKIRERGFEGSDAKPAGQREQGRFIEGSGNGSLRNNSGGNRGFRN